MGKNNGINLYNSSYTLFESHDEPQHYICKHCGKLVKVSDFHNDDKWHTQMLGKMLCFECVYWMDIVSNPVPFQQIIDGSCYSALPFLSDWEGKVYYIFMKNGTILRSRCLVPYGKIPKKFIKKFPNTGTFVPWSTARIIKANQGHKCFRKGCWDRTHCHWYKGPEGWNKIPKNYVLGGEMCPIFVDKTKFKI